MDFPKSITINACESFLEGLSDMASSEPLLLPVGTTGYASSFGGLASAIQAINTWVRQSENRVLCLTPSSATDEIEEVIIRPHKFVAAMSAKSIVLANGADRDLRPQVNAAAKLAIESQACHQYGQQRGGLCWFAFVDHSSKGFDRNFYIGRSGEKPEPRQPEQFKAVIGAMVDKAMAVAGGAKTLERDSLAYLGRIFYELFLNTHEHGTRGDYRSEWLKPGVRVIYAQGINLSEAAIKNAAEGHPILSDYLSAVTKRQPNESQMRFVEIGVVDSGLGYCGRWLADHQYGNKNQEPSVKHEYGVFKKCFSFRQTSTTKDSKGDGLPIVMERLTKLEGFMRVRSGRLSFYRDFLSSPYEPNDACAFYDWHSGRSTEESVTPMAKACGVSISLLIPVETKNE